MCRSDRGSGWLRLLLRQRWRNAENVKVGCIRGGTYVCVDVYATNNSKVAKCFEAALVHSSEALKRTSTRQRRFE